jgi:hypothetical protein
MPPIFAGPLATAEASIRLPRDGTGRYGPGRPAPASSRKQSRAHRPTRRLRLVQSSSSGAESAARCSAHPTKRPLRARAFGGDRRGSRAARPRREARFEAVPCVRRGGLGYFAVVLSRVGRGDSRRMTRPSSSRRGSCGGETRRGAVASGRLIAADAQSSCVAVWLGFGAWSCSGALPRGKVSSCSSR